jgi:hypothetical protein
MALQVYEDMLDAEIYRRAIESVNKPVIPKSESLPPTREYRDNLLMFLPKKMDLSYRDN